MHIRIDHDRDHLRYTGSGRGDASGRAEKEGRYSSRGKNSLHVYCMSIVCTRVCVCTEILYV